jgi:phosphoribosylaminoimidazolecarboxamide formyltransferase/IMP cyclohydrolase
MSWTIDKIADLRYGENPHQMAALYQMAHGGGLANAEVLSGKEMSFNNYVDADAAWDLVCDFDETACAIIKHTNPAGVGLGETPAEAIQKHWRPIRFQRLVESWRSIAQSTRMLLRK